MSQRTQEKRDLKPNDRLLRQNGFRIEHRPKDKPAIWSLCGEMFTEQAALKWCEEDKK